MRVPGQTRKRFEATEGNRGHWRAAGPSPSLLTSLAVSPTSGSKYWEKGGFCFQKVGELRLPPANGPREQDPWGHCGGGGGARSCPGFPGGGQGGCLGLSIRWALDNQPCHGQGLSLVLRPQGLLPRETTLAEGAAARTCQLSGRRFLGLRTRPRGHRRGEAGGGGQGGSEGSVRPAASRLGSGRGRPGYYCPVLPPHQAGAAPGRHPLGPREAASGSCLWRGEVRSAGPSCLHSAGGT